MDEKDEVVILTPSEQLNKETDDVVNKVMTTQSSDEMKQYLAMFNLNIAKKNVLRVLKFYGLLDVVTDLTSERLAKRPDELTNKELLDCMNVLQASIERTNKVLGSVNDQPAIQMQQNNQVNINVNNLATELGRDSKQKVLDAIGAFLKAARDSKPEPVEAEVVDIKEKEGE